MQTLDRFPAEALRSVRGILTDLDDTLTQEGKLQPPVYAALARLKAAGLRVAVVTGRPAGWGDLIARLWPVDGVIAENGAVAFFEAEGHVQRLVHPSVQDPDMPIRLERLRQTVLRAVPGSRLATDQFCRLYDVAFDVSESLPHASEETVVALFKVLAHEGAVAQRSSIHINAWFGSYDKLAMARLWIQHLWQEDLAAQRRAWVCIGDSPNDAPLFSFFPLSVGVANIRRVAGDMPALPQYVTALPCGAGFLEVAERLLLARAGP
jgi:HAD superfamily hydrolase (TIGR01484 family)